MTAVQTCALPIWSIDSDGYLRRDLESVADDIAFTVGLETTPEELEELLGEIHQLEPAGVGARDLRECLLLQLGEWRASSRPRRLARRILADYFDEFVKKHYEKLLTRLQITEEEFREAMGEIRKLSPKPGNLYVEGGTDTTPYIIPDFILDCEDGVFSLSLNGGNVPVGEDGQTAHEEGKALEDVEGQHFQRAPGAQQQAVEGAAAGGILGRRAQSHGQLAQGGAAGGKLGERLVAKPDQQQYAVRAIELGEQDRKSVV